MLTCTFEFSLSDDGNFSIIQSFGDINEADLKKLEEGTNTDESLQDNAPKDNQRIIWSRGTRRLIV